MHYFGPPLIAGHFEQTDWQTDRPTNRQRDRQAERLIKRLMDKSTTLAPHLL